jgi:hypothetical protein
VSLDAHWPEWRRTGTDTKRQEGETGLRQRLKMGGVCGEREGQEEVGQLGKTTSSPRPPGVRH